MTENINLTSDNWRCLLIFNGVLNIDEGIVAMDGRGVDKIPPILFRMLLLLLDDGTFIAGGVLGL